MTTNEASFQYDVFLSHSAKDKAVVRPLAERLQADGLSPNAKGRRLNAEVALQPSAFSLQPLLRAFGSDRAQLLIYPQPSTLNPQLSTLNQLAPR